MARPPLPPPEPITLVPLAEIASGGMGSVALARVEGGRLAGQALAIKRLHPNIAQDPQFVGMFLDEAWMTSALRSKNVVQVAAWGEDQKGMFLAVELVQGVSLARLIKESRANEEPFAERTVANIGSQICGGLAAAHDLRGPDGKTLGLVHRDLTPGNVLVGFDGVVKIADFGIAKAEERITHTRTGTLKGKPAYMAPEQARAGTIDHRADLFSFGVMMFELLAGRRPWLAKGTFEVMMEAAQSPTPDLASIRKNVNPMFVRIVNRCLSKKAAERHDNAAQIQEELDAWRRSKGFVHDDVESLSGFVRRNSTRQIAWFEQALHGDYARGGAPTFKELEEKIDDSRDDRRRSGMRPAAGASPSGAGGRASAPAMQAAAPSPRPEPPPVPHRATPAGQSGAVPTSGRAALEQLSAQRPQTDPSPGPGGLPNASLGATTSDLDRTVALDRSGPPLSEAATMLDPRQLGRAPITGGTVPMPRAAVREAIASAQPEQPAGWGTERMSPSPFAHGRVPPPRPSAPGSPQQAPATRLSGTSLSASDPLPPPSPQVAPPKRSRAGLLLLLAIPLLIGAAFAGYRFRHRLLLAPPAAPATTGSAEAPR